MDISANPDSEKFVKGLKEGDKLLVVRQGELYLTAYGPIDENKLYTFGE